jgi:hypothetical protein
VELYIHSPLRLHDVETSKNGITKLRLERCHGRSSTERTIGPIDRTLQVPLSEQHGTCLP